MAPVKCWKKKSHPRILYIAIIYSNNEDEIKTFFRQTKAEKNCCHQTGTGEVLKEVFQVEEK